MNQTKGKVILFYPTIPGVWKYVWFPFPYLYLGPFLEGAGYEVKVIDARVDGNWRDILIREIKNCTCFGITGMTGPDLSNAMDACRLVRDTNPNLPIIWGGHHARVLPEQILKEKVGDYVFTGPAEYGLVQLLNAIENKKAPEGIQGFIYRQNDSFIGDKTPQAIKFGYDIFPGYNLIDIEKYRSPNNIVSYFSSRGCPFQCTFCTTGDSHHSYRSIGQFEQEIGFLVNDCGFSNVFFQDGTFFVSKKRVMTLARKLARLTSKVKWKAKARANSLLNYSPEEMRSLHQSGLRSIFFGIESGSQKVLDSMKKIIKPDQAIESVKLCLNYGFEFYASFMFATPGETVDDLKHTVSLIRQIEKLDPKATIQNSVYIPLPGTPMYEMCIARGYQPPKTMIEWSKRSISSNLDNRDDITWMDPLVFKEYKNIYEKEFPDYKHVFEREKIGEYQSPLR